MEKQIKEKFEKVENRLDHLESTVSKGSLSKKGKLIKCDGCNHLWRTQSKMQMVSCPNCAKKVNIKENSGVKLK